MPLNKKCQVIKHGELVIMIIRAFETHAGIVKRIAQNTIESVYPKYYPCGAVDFFKNHHNDSNIEEDIKAGFVYVLQIEDEYVGTVTIKKNEICRLFVLPDYQHKGYGRKLLDFAEEIVKKEYASIVVAASLPAKKIYKLRGYKEVEYHQITTKNGDILCYDVMEKEIEVS